MKPNWKKIEMVMCGELVGNVKVAGFKVVQSNILFVQLAFKRKGNAK